MVSIEESLDTLAKATEANATIIKETPTITKKLEKLETKLTISLTFCKMEIKIPKQLTFLSEIRKSIAISMATK